MMDLTPLMVVFERFNDPLIVHFLMYLAAKGLIDFGGAVTKEVVSEGVAQSIYKTWTKVKGKICGSPQGKQLLNNLEKDPENSKLNEELANEIGKVFESNDSLKNEIEKLGNEIRCSLKALHEDHEGQNTRLARIEDRLEELLRIQQPSLSGGEVPAPQPSPEAVELAKAIPDDASPYALALKAIAERDYKKADVLFNQAQEDKETELVDIYIGRGRAKFYAGFYTAAVPWFVKAIELKPDDPYILNETAVVLLYAGQFKKAKPVCRKAVKLMKKALGDEHPNYATSLNNLAFVYKSQGKYEKAEPLFEQALEIKKKALGEEHPDYARPLNNLAGLYFSQGKYEKAEPLIEQVSEIMKMALGEEHPDYATSLNNLALLYKSQGKYEKAEPLYRQAMEIKKKALGEEHPTYATSLNNLALLYRSQGKYEKAEPLYRQAMEIRKKALGEEHPDSANSLNNLAGLYFSQGKCEEAESLFIEALGIWKKAIGEGHPDYAILLDNLAGLYKSQGKYKEAVPLCKQALEIFEKILGCDHPDTQIVRIKLKELRKKMQENKE